MSSETPLNVHTLVTGPFRENCHLVWDEATSEALVVDPGDEADRILAEVRQRGLDVKLLVCTHAHIDHVGAVAALKRTLGAPFALHRDELEVLKAVPRAAALFGLPEPEVPEVDRRLTHGDLIHLGSQTARVLHTPGHSPGGCCIHFEEAGLVLSGDTLFAGSVGRTDLPGGSTETLIVSIEEQLLALPETTVVHPGHGPATSIGAERQHNPFLQEGGAALV